MDPGTSFGLSSGEYAAHHPVDIHGQSRFSISSPLPPKQRYPVTYSMSPRSTPESVPLSTCSCPSCPPTQHIYTPPTLQHYILPDMSDMAEIIPYSMERVHLREENYIYQPSQSLHVIPVCDSFDTTSISTTTTTTTSTTPALQPTDYFTSPQDWLRHSSDYYLDTYLPPRTSSAVAVAAMTQTPVPSPLSHISASTDTPGPPTPNNQKDLTNYGIRNPDQTWQCAYPGCSSKTLFRRGCDLRKHYNRHRKHLFCRHKGCPQAVQGGFSSKKDRDRHEAKHNPLVPCEWEGCQRMFSRVDNMKDHVRRIHKRREP
ncbi:hypothetical protein BDV28DRAFT_139561 [Aspergillus coremiiformis]|uniref:C2H2-type domain-containing protein n=1 Tax=Aspergillus coremiiformis TaxID=138285 RepID=A0A5N6YXN8_9EURO|nr:hypothetical protein BDV28DRAFT_139561 [Aspergillus coremiiformis]